MLHYSPKTQSGHIPTRFPTLSISSCNLSACLPWGLSKVWAAGFPQEGWRLWSLCVSCLRQKIWALLWANSATKTSLALQACCCSGNLKPPISNVITSWLSLLLHQGGYFVNLEKAKNIEIDFFLQGFLLTPLRKPHFFLCDYFGTYLQTANVWNLFYQPLNISC